MLQILEITKDNLIATKAEGKLTEKDVGKVHPLIHNILNTGKKVRWYFEMVDFTGWETTAFWKDMKMDMKHANDYEKIAMVGEKKWQDWMAQFMEPFTSAEVKYFDVSQKEEALNWITI